MDTTLSGYGEDWACQICKENKQTIKDADLRLLQ